MTIGSAHGLQGTGGIHIAPKEEDRKDVQPPTIGQQLSQSNIWDVEKQHKISPNMLTGGASIW